MFARHLRVGRQGRLWCWLAPALLASLAAPALAQQSERDIQELHAVLDGLERGTQALERLERHDLADRMRQVMDEVRQKIERAGQAAHEGREGNDESFQQLEIARHAVEAFREVRQDEAADRLEHAIRARRLELEGRDDPEAREIRRQAPEIGEVIDLLRRAAGMWDERGQERKAHALRELAERVQREAGQNEQGRPEGREREAARRHLEIVELAVHAFREAERPDAAERLEQAIHAHRLALEGRPEAREALHHAPPPEEVIGLLNEAANLWDEWGHEQKARMLREVAADHRRRQGGEDVMRPADGPEAHADALRRLAEVEQQVQDLRRALERIEQRMQRLARARNSF